jgi:hypothetical protein
MKNRFFKKIAVWAIGLSFGVNCLSCAIVPSKKEGAPPRTEPAPTPQNPKPPTGEKEPVPMKTREPVPSVQKAALSSVAPPPTEHEAPPPSQVKAEPKPRETHIAHTVKWSGETLSIISLWYTGNQGNWKAIAQTNANLDPNRIYVGNEILIPVGLVKTQNSLPKEFVDRFYSKAKKEKPKPIPNSGQTQEEEPKLFGPKKSSK